RPGRAGKMLQGRQQAGTHGFIVPGDSAELAMITAQPLEEGSQVIDPVYLGNDLHERIDEVPALRRHRDREHLPHLRMLDEEVGVEEQRYLVTVHRDTGEALPQPGNVQPSRLSRPPAIS